MNRLNEELLRVPNMETDDKIVTAVNPDYSDAVNEHKKIEDKLKDDFKEQEKEKEAFIKDTERREIKFSAPKQIKQMKLAESLFEDYSEAPDTYIEPLDEAFSYDEPTNMGKGYTAPLVDDYTSDITQLVKIIDEGDKHFAKPALKRIVKRLFDNKQSVENFNAYWEERYPASIGSIDRQLELIGPMLLKELLSDSVEESMNEATAVAEPTIVYKKKREPLADILMAELSEGEVVYRKHPDGRLVPTNGPHFNIDYDDVAAGYDDNGDYIIAWVADEGLANKVATLGDKYDREAVIGNDKYVSDTPYFVKIYVTDDDWETPYVNPNVQVR